MFRWGKKQPANATPQTNSAPPIQAKHRELSALRSAAFEDLFGSKAVAGYDALTLGSSVEDAILIDIFVYEDEAFHLRVIDPTLSSDVLPGDRVMVGLHIANSEVGKRAVTVDVLVFQQAKELKNANSGQSPDCPLPYILRKTPATDCVLIDTSGKCRIWRPCRLQWNEFLR